MNAATQMPSAKTRPIRIRTEFGESEFLLATSVKVSDGIGYSRLRVLQCGNVAGSYVCQKVEDWRRRSASYLLRSD